MADREVLRTTKTPLKCDFCDASAVTEVEGVQRFGFMRNPVGPPVDLYATVVVWTCGACELQWTDEAGEKAREEAVQQHLRNDVLQRQAIDREYLKGQLEELREDALRGFRIANALTLETQSVEDMATELVRLVRMHSERAWNAENRLLALLNEQREKVAAEAVEALIESGEDPRAADSMGVRLRSVSLVWNPLDTPKPKGS